MAFFYLYLCLLSHPIYTAVSQTYAFNSKSINFSVSMPRLCEQMPKRPLFCLHSPGWDKKRSPWRYKDYDDDDWRTKTKTLHPQSGLEIYTRKTLLGSLKHSERCFSLARFRSTEESLFYLIVSKKLIRTSQSLLKLRRQVGKEKVDPWIIWWWKLNTLYNAYVYSIVLI